MWLEGLTDEEIDELLPNWLESCVVFGEIPQSGNYYLLPMLGEEAGRVFEFAHDGFEFIERGESIDEFLSYITTVNATLIEDIMTYTRYSDCETNTQWLPDKYMYDE